jgi:signal-transduction protein with cAMP-binding, CBS, and nucleotidyltransferase domain
MSDRQLIRVKDVMKTDFDMVDGLDTVQMALERMIHIDTKSLIVKKRHDDDEYGLVTLSDIARQVLAKDRAPERVNIYEIMTKPALTISSSMDIRYAARIFSRFELTRAPVLDNRKIVGIVSLTDMVLKGLKANSESS